LNNFKQKLEAQENPAQALIPSQRCHRP